MNHLKRLILSGLFFCLFLTGCGSPSLVQPSPTLHAAHSTLANQRSASLTLQVTGRDQVSQQPTPPRSWTITDVHAIHQLLEEIQRLPAHHNVGADTCARPYYAYTLDFYTGTVHVQHDDLYSYCLTLTSADGSEYDPTTTFYSLLTGMLHLSKKELLGW